MVQLKLVNLFVEKQVMVPATLPPGQKGSREFARARVDGVITRNNAILR